MQAGALSRPMIAAAVALGLAALIVLYQVPQVFGALFAPGPGDDVTLATFAEYLERHAADAEAYRSRFDGRSLFYQPVRPKAAAGPPKVAVKEPEPEEAPAPPPIATRYTGPSILYVIGDEVGFHGTDRPIRVRVGEERDGLRVIAANPPWSVTVGYSGGTYEVEILSRESRILESGASAARSAVSKYLIARSDDDEKPAGSGEEP